MVSPTVGDTVHATDWVAAGLEDLQLTLGQGPCVVAFTAGGSVLADVLAFGDAASMLLLDEAAGTPPDTAELTGQRDDPTAHRAQVYRATGMTLVQLGISAEAAFARLRACAYDRRPGDVVERRLCFEPDPPSGGHDAQ